MTETPTAAPAAPVAPAASAPVAPAAPAAAPVAAPVTPPAPAAVPPVAPAAAAPVDSLLPADPPAPAAVPQTDAEKIAAAKVLVAAAEAAADPNGGKAWLLHDGVMGEGERPAWFKQDKYKTVSAQAEAYVGLEKRFGGFVGAPKNEKGEVAYAFTAPEGVTFAADHPLATAFTKWAGENQLSQAGYTELLGQLIQYETAQEPNIGQMKARLGENADARIAAVAQWGKANLGNEGYALLRDATSGKTADAVLKVLELVIPKTAQFKMPKPGADVPAGSGGDALAKIKADHGAKMPNGQFRKDVDPAYAAEIDKRYRDYFASGGQ